MIKSFRIFEALPIKDMPNFDVGDKVVCIDEEGYRKVLKIGKIYTISHLTKDADYKYCRVDNYHYQFACTRFLNLVDYELIKYNL